MEELSDLIFLSQEEAEAAVAEVEVEVASVEIEEEAEAEASVEEEAEASVEIEVEASEEEAEVEVSAETEVEAEAEEEASVVHQEEDSITTPVAHQTVKCCERFERHHVAESKYNNYNQSFIFGCLLLPRRSP